MRQRRLYDDEFKRDAVRLLVSSGRTLKDVGNELGVERSNLGRWRREAMEKLNGQVAGTNAVEMKPSEMDLEIRKLRKELHYVKEQRDILKKAISIFSRTGEEHTSL